MKITTQHDGKDIEVEVPDDQFVPFAEHNATMARLRREATDATKGRKTADEWLADEGFQKTARERLAVKADTGKLTADELAKARQSWEAEALTPLQQQAQKAAEKVARLQQKQLEARIVEEAAARGVKKEFLQRDTKSGAPRIVKLLAGEFGYSEEHDEFFERDGDKPDAFAYAASGKYGKPYRTVAEFFDGWAGDKANALFLDDVRQRGAGLGTPSGAGSASHVISATDARDPMKYRAAKAAADKAGVPLQMSDA
jgi:hypothetical protein